ncbi:LOW QUALITY PROTEIN: choline transporter-like protein 2 [Etheostoma spectabile]|uniref:LOW QUALITY PROTEIN: choline transporter-like protein 2 n=1 Tax=Etheostoma spectabile TaxID=54343 RepID=UPI0013AFCDCE|nr:LOW QUALITY PROTEIN: choline transporter-like protein 2 [Etheostoma spectabile]
MPEEREGEFYGKNGEPRKFDPTFKGPIQNRGCTDIVCCILFVIAIVGYVAVGILAWSQGDPRKVIYPTDSRGQFCGQAGTPQAHGQAVLFYFNIMKWASPMVRVGFQCPTTQMCVEKCPERFLTLVKAYANKNDFDYYKTFCKEGVTNTMGIPEILKQGLCPAMLMPSKPFTRRCFPALGESGGVITVGNNSKFDDGRGNIRDAKICWMESRKNCIGGIFHCYMEYAALKGTAGSDVTLQQLGFQTDFAVYLQIRQTWLAFMIILAIVEVIIILLLIFLRKRILIAIALIKEASRAIGHVIFLPFFNPLLTFASWPWSCLNGPQCFFFLFTKLTPRISRTKFLLALAEVPWLSVLWRSYNRAKTLGLHLSAEHGLLPPHRTHDQLFIGSFSFFLSSLLLLSLSQWIFPAFFFFSRDGEAFESTAPQSPPNYWVSTYWVPILTVVGSAFLPSPTGFFMCHAMCVDTLFLLFFLCFVEDLERNDGSAERPYLMPESLRKVLNKKNKTEPAQ